MARKRKIEKTELDEAERSLYGSFRNAVSSVTSLYSLQKQQTSLAYQAGKRHAVHVLYRWIYSAHQEGSITSSEEILLHLHERLGAVGDLSASADTQNQVQLSPQRQETQLERPPEYIAVSTEGDPTEAGVDGLCLVHSGLTGTTPHQNNNPTSFACDYNQSSCQQKESHLCEENDSSMDTSCS